MFIRTIVEPITKYGCDICKTEYPTEAEARTCEKQCRCKHENQEGSPGFMITIFYCVDCGKHMGDDY